MQPHKAVEQVFDTRSKLCAAIDEVEKAAAEPYKERLRDVT